MNDPLPTCRMRAHRTVLLATLAVLMAACANFPGQAPSVPSAAQPRDVRTEPPAPVVTVTPQQPASAPAATQANSGVAAHVQADTAATDTSTAAPVDPLRPDVRIDLEDRAARQDLWQRIRNGFAMNTLEGDLVRKAEAMYASKPDYVQRMNERGGRYLFHIVEEVQRRNMPTELALLPFIESAFNPEAMSHARASGMWQFMPATGRVFNLKQNVFRDDRRDVLASTRAALDYLTKLHGMFGDWHLALAAYNWGEGSVQRAINRNKAAGLPTDYVSLSMPNETRYYVPKLQAIKNIVAAPTNHGLRLPPLENHPYFLSVGIERDMDVDLAARLAGLPIADFKALNPQMNKPVLLAAGTPQILLPYDNANQFIKALAKQKGPLASWTAWTTTQTMRSADAARQVGMSDEQFRLVNNIPPRMLIKVGSTVLVPRSAQRQTDVSEHVADHASLSLAHEAPPLRKATHKVGPRGDTVAAVAARYRVSAAQVAQWNKVSAQGRFGPGTKVVLHLPAVKKAKQATRHAHAKGSRATKAHVRKNGSPKTASTQRPIKPTRVAKAPAR